MTINHSHYLLSCVIMTSLLKTITCYIVRPMVKSPTAVHLTMLPVDVSNRYATATTRCYSSSSSSTEASLQAWKEVSLDECQNLVQVASQAAKAAGQVITSHVGCCSQLDEECEVKFNPKDVVTEYDKQAQQAVESIIKGQYPQHSFLGEEDVDPGAAASEAALIDILQRPDTSDYLWICDPIDGTANFAAGMTLCGVTVAVVYKGVPLIGVIYDPHSDELYTAIKGQGALLNGEPIFVAQAVTEAKNAIVNAGCPADPKAFEVSMRGVLALNSKSRGLRMIACSALTTAWIAAGRLNAHFGYDLSCWDLIAGALLIHEAGGLVTDIDGSPYKLTTRNMLCSNGLVHDEILGILRDADAVSFTRS